MNSSIFLIFVLKKLVQVQYFTLELQRVCTHMEKSSPVTIKALNYVCMHLKSSPLFNKVQNVIPSLFSPLYWPCQLSFSPTQSCNIPFTGPTLGTTLEVWFATTLISNTRQLKKKLLKKLLMSNGWTWPQLGQAPLPAAAGSGDIASTKWISVAHPNWKRLGNSLPPPFVTLQKEQCSTS